MRGVSRRSGGCKWKYGIKECAHTTHNTHTRSVLSHQIQSCNWTILWRLKSSAFSVVPSKRTLDTNVYARGMESSSQLSKLANSWHNVSIWMISTKKKYSSIDCIISCERSFIVCTKFPALYCHVHYVFDRIEFAKLLMITSNNFCWLNQFRSPQFLPLVWTLYSCILSWINNKCTNGTNHFWKYHAVLHLWNTRESRVLHGARSGAGTNQLHSKHPLSTLTIHCIALVCYSGDVTVFFATT